MIEFADNAGVRIAYSVFGKRSAPPLLMVRGLGRTSRHWGSIIRELESSFRLVLIDNRGIGRSDVPFRPWTTADMADDAARVLDAVGMPAAHVFGVSLGGMIAQELALRHPQRLLSLTLGCTRAGGKLSTRVGWRTMLELVAPMRHGAEAAVRLTAPLILSREFFEAHPEVVDEWVQIAREHPPTRRGVLAQLLAAARHDASARLGQIRAKTLIVSGDADRLIDIENSRRLVRAISGAELVLLPGVGHDFPTERPSETAALLRRFCE